MDETGILSQLSVRSLSTPDDVVRVLKTYSFLVHSMISHRSALHVKILDGFRIYVLFLRGNIVGFVVPCFVMENGAIYVVNSTRSHCSRAAG